MKVKKKKINSLCLILISTFLCLGTIFNSGAGTINASAAVQSAENAYKSVQNSSGNVLDSKVKTKITALSADIQGIILIVVMAFLICSTLWTSTKFAGAGDNPQQKAILKNALMFQVLGIAFVASYSGLVLFGLQNLNLFSS